MKSEVIVPATGELLSYASGTKEEVLESLKVVDSYHEAYRQLKAMLKDRAVEMLRREGNK